MFRHRHQLRLWSARVLLMWLLALGAPMAHACLSPGQDAPVALAQAADGMASHQEHQHHQAQGEQGAVAKTNCQDFCAKATVSLPSFKPALDTLQWHAVFIVAAAPAVPLPAFESAPWRVPRRDGVAAPPIHIAFLRLTL